MKLYFLFINIVMVLANPYDFKLTDDKDWKVKVTINTHTSGVVWAKG